jgi:hypothetical protein
LLLEQSQRTEENTRSVAIRNKVWEGATSDHPRR